MITPPIELLPRPHLLIGGDHVEETSGGRYLHHYAGTGQPTAEVAVAGPADVDLAVRQASIGLSAWRGLGLDKRRDALLALADQVLLHADELSTLQAVEIGIPRQLANQMPRLAADCLRYHAGWVDKIGGDVVATWPIRALDYTLDEPYGVVALIIPWNGAVMSMAQMLGPALAAGNAVVVKPPPAAAFVALRIGELAMAAGIPAGVVNVVPGGPEAGDALVRHRGVDKVHFTGSESTARAVLTAALDNLTPVGLELGGKSAHVIFADGDLRLAARLAMAGAVALTGQGCANGTRVLIEESVYEEVLAIIVARMRKVVVGDPLDLRTVTGPVVSDAACHRILAVIERAQAGAGRLVLGGSRLGDDLADGYFVEPTVFAEVDPASELAQEEIFGPVLAVMPFRTEEDAVRLANGTRYGLGAYVHTRNLRRAHLVSHRMQAGSVWVNGVPGMLPSAPFGGVKSSGVGRIGGVAGVREFLRPKNVWVGL